MFERQFGKQQLRDAVGFLQMRVAREDEGVGANAAVFVDSLGERVGISN